jgi:hypothetical protein
MPALLSDKPEISTVQGCQAGGGGGISRAQAVRGKPCCALCDVRPVSPAVLYLRVSRLSSPVGKKARVADQGSVLCSLDDQVAFLGTSAACALFQRTAQLLQMARPRP